MIKRYKHQKKQRVIRVKSRILTGSKLGYKLVVNKSNKYIRVQVVDLKTGKTVCGVMSKKADEAGIMIAKKAKAAKIDKVIFDRRSNKFHGRVQLLAESARKAGLVI
jgi:large subunit ribosomal protein L18